MKLSVYLEQFPEPVGALDDGDDGAPRFTYDLDFLARPDAAPLSVSMPLEQKTFAPLTTRAFFANLLPEGRALDEIAARFRLDATDFMALLAHLGADCAGAVSVVPEDAQPPKRPGVVPNDYVKQSTAELSDEIAALVLGTRSEKLPEASLAGVQRKTSLYLEGDVSFRPKPGAPTTHIIKVGDDDLDDLVENEAFCLAVARAMGLDAVKAETRRAGERSFLAVERYDRVHVRDSGHTIHRLHQEDFAQALSLYPTSRKYSHKDGPTAEDCFALADLAAEPALFRRDLLRGFILAFLLGNADAHAKNFSLLYGKKGLELAPLYDLVCIGLYPRFFKGLALSVGGEQAYEKIDRAAWKRFAVTARFGKSYVEHEIETLTRKILPAAEAVASAPTASRRVADHIRGVIGHQVRLINQAFGFAVPDDAPPLMEKAGGWLGGS